MTSERYYKALFNISGVYDVVLGFGFLFFYKWMYDYFGINLPSNPAYVSMLAVLFGIYGILLFMIAREPFRQRSAIVFVLLVKIGFVLVIGYYLLVNASLIDMPFRVFAVIDFVFALLFAESLRHAR